MLIKKYNWLITASLVFLGLLSLIVKTVNAQETGTISSTNRYAWSENLGWIDFGTTEGNVTIADSAFTGYAWGENIGWISLNCANTNSCAVSDYKVSNNNEGDLSGYAWSENVGWINFNPTNGGVIIGNDGIFSGSAWGENTGWVIFNCATTVSCAVVDYKISTDWRPRNVRPACNNSSDDDSDGKIDYPADPGCSSLTDTSETDSSGGGGGGSPSSYSPGDANKDNKVDLLDFNILMVNWGSINTDPTTRNIADFNSDNKVDLLDFNILMVNWTR